MEKLSTGKLKELISEWLSTPEIEKSFDADVYKLFSDGSQWKREEKEKIGESWEDYMSTYTYPLGPNSTKVPYWNADFAGEADMKLVTELFNDPKIAEKCILRVFVPKNDLADNYRLEVITTPDDTKVVGWTVVED